MTTRDELSTIFNYFPQGEVPASLEELAAQVRAVAALVGPPPTEYLCLSAAWLSQGQRAEVVRQHREKLPEAARDLPRTYEWRVSALVERGGVVVIEARHFAVRSLPTFGAAPPGVLRGVDPATEEEEAE